MTKPCKCGCGKPAPIAMRNDPRRGHVKGQPMRFIRGHGSRQELEPRFWRYVDKRPGQGPQGECWEWTGNRTEHGYGQIEIDGKAFRAHRVAWQLKHGQIPAGVKVLHRCDNPPCCRDEHLFIGTQGDNIKDAVKKNRHSKSRNTHCPSGHLFDGVNSQGARVCSICQSERSRRYYIRKKRRADGETKKNVR